MDRLIGTLLDLGKLQSGNLDLSLSTVPPGQLMTTVLDTARVLAAEAGLTLDLEVGSAPPVRCDPDRIVQVLTNLVDNALKFTPAGGRILLAVERADREVVFRVTDNGPGIAPEDRAHVFDRYFRTRSSRKPGTGLGLAISAALVAQHGGRIWVDSEVGRGSTFAFSLPLDGPAGSSAPEEG